jgi:CO dehydrogenase/acetyl-CoA synthase epsilon subunit
MAIPINRCGVKKAKPLAIGVDLDGLLKTESWHVSCATDSIMLNGKEYKFKPRPHVVSFIEKLSNYGEIIICSKATLRYSKEISKKLGISKYVTNFVSRDYDGMGDYHSVILIDNDKDIAKEKEFILKRHCDNLKIVLIDTYVGSDSDNSLMRTLIEIERLLND